METSPRIRHGLRGYVNRFSHTVINVSDLDRAVEFYEATFPVRRRTRINGPAQAYPGLGVAHGQFAGWVMESCEIVAHEATNLGHDRTQLSSMAQRA